MLNTSPEFAYYLNANRTFFKKKWKLSLFWQNVQDYGRFRRVCLSWRRLSRFALWSSRSKNQATHVDCTFNNTSKRVFVLWPEKMLDLYFFLTSFLNQIFLLDTRNTILKKPAEKSQWRVPKNFFTSFSKKNIPWNLLRKCTFLF